MSYTKLFSSIVTSTIWVESPAVCKVWITMLAIADKHGEVHASIPGLAQIAGLTLQEVETAVQKFLSPDKYSRTPDDEGRRIEPIDGGWVLINHAKYREMASKEESQNASAKRQAAFRERQRRNGKVTHSNGSAPKSNATVTPKRDIAEAEAEAVKAVDPSETPPAVLPKPAKTSREAELMAVAGTIYDAYPRKVARADAIKAIRKAMDLVDADTLRLRTQAYAAAVASWPSDEMQFVPHPATWFNRGSYDDDPATWARKGAGLNGHANGTHSRPKPKERVFIRRTREELLALGEDPRNLIPEAAVRS